VPAAERSAPAQARISLVGGKGGVGKTTVAAALALLLARRGHRTLLVSTDPAHSTADLLGVAPSDDRPVRVGPRWSMLEIDAEQVARRHVERIADEARDVVPRDVLPAVRRHLDAALASPGTQESALLDRLGDVLLDATSGDEWDQVVVDTAPTGHTLRLLALPDLLSGWVEGLLRQRETFLRTDALAAGLVRDEPLHDRPDPVAERLRGRRDQLTALRRLLLDDAVVHLVLVPERLAVLETERAHRTLREAGMSLGALVVNRVFPAGDHPFLQARLRRQEEEQARLAGLFGGMPRVQLPHLAEDPGLGDLPRLAAVLEAALPAGTAL
jgi:arsenite/tail-anchored protein-transporting ATPase